jgi:hypothetical protein
VRAFPAGRRRERGPHGPFAHRGRGPAALIAQISKYAMRNIENSLFLVIPK